MKYPREKIHTSLLQGYGEQCEMSLFFYLRISPQHMCMKECKTYGKLSLNSHVWFLFSFPYRKKHQNLQNIQAKRHINWNSTEGLQACLACKKMLPSWVGLTTPAIPLHSYPSFFTPRAEFPVNQQGKRKQPPPLHNCVHLLHPNASFQVTCPPPPGWSKKMEGRGRLVGCPNLICRVGGREERKKAVRG